MKQLPICDPFAGSCRHTSSIHVLILIEAGNFSCKGIATDVVIGNLIKSCQAVLFIVVVVVVMTPFASSECKNKITINTHV